MTQKSAFRPLDDVPLKEALKLKEVVYKLHQPLWKKYDLSQINLNIQNWTTIKYLNDNGDGFHDDIQTLPNDKGGLYLFSIKCPVIPGITDFPAYLGRAQLTQHQNLRKRCREYFTKWHRTDERPLITTMIDYWGPDLYLSFIALEENEEIKDYEKRLINSLKLPFNYEIPDLDIKRAHKAFQQ